MRIAIFSDTFFPQRNGVVTVVYQSALALSKLGHEVCIVVISSETESNLKNKLNDKIEIINLPSLPFFGYKGERISFPLGLALRKIKKFKPDVIHVHTSFGVGWEAVICAKFLKIPLIGTHHTFFDYYLKHVKLDFNLVKWISWKYIVAHFNRCDLLLSPSQALSDELIAKGLKTPSSVILNPTDINFFVPVESDKQKQKLKRRYNLPGKSIVYMGRVSYEKSIDQVIKSFALVNKQKPETRMMILGQGPEKSNLEKLCRELNLEDKIIFTGRYDHDNELLDLLHANDIFVTACKNENLPVAVLEAMASGLPVVAVREKGLIEVVSDNLNGYLVEADSPELLAEKIVQLLDDKEINRFALASRELTYKYSPQEFAKNLESYYKNLIIKTLIK